MNKPKNALEAMESMMTPEDIQKSDQIFHQLKLADLIKSKVPRLQAWEIEGLAKVIVEAGYKLVKHDQHCIACLDFQLRGFSNNSHTCGKRQS